MKTGPRTLLGASLKLSYSPLIDASKRGKVLELSALHVPEEKRGNKLGTALMVMVCLEADKAGKALILSPDSDKLACWYSRFGFELVDDNLMIRKAQ